MVSMAGEEGGGRERGGGREVQEVRFLASCRVYSCGVAPVESFASGTVCTSGGRNGPAVVCAWDLYLVLSGRKGDGGWSGGWVTVRWAGSLESCGRWSRWGLWLEVGGKRGAVCSVSGQWACFLEERHDVLCGSRVLRLGSHALTLPAYERSSW